MTLDEKKMSTLFKAFCDENRIRILKLLRTGEKCACVLLEDLHISQPTLSHHMKVLCDSGVVVGRKERKWMYYSLSAPGTEYAVNCLKVLVAADIADHDTPCCEK